MSSSDQPIEPSSGGGGAELGEALRNWKTAVDNNRPQISVQLSQVLAEYGRYPTQIRGLVLSHKTPDETPNPLTRSINEVFRQYDSSDVHVTLVFDSEFDPDSLGVGDEDFFCEDIDIGVAYFCCGPRPMPGPLGSVCACRPCMPGWEYEGRDVMRRRLDFGS